MMNVSCRAVVIHASRFSKGKKYRWRVKVKIPYFTSVVRNAHDLTKKTWGRKYANFTPLSTSVFRFSGI